VWDRPQGLSCANSRPEHLQQVTFPQADECSCDGWPKELTSLQLKTVAKDHPPRRFLLVALAIQLVPDFS
jgi:hypothetical protein